MRILFALAVLIFCAPISIAASDGADVAALNEAWREYQRSVESGSMDERVNAARKALGAGRKALDPGDEKLLALMQNYAGELVNGGRYEEAAELLERTLDTMEVIYGADSPNLIMVLANLADASGGYAEHNTQLQYYRRALKLTEKNYGKNSLEYANLAYRTGTKVYDLSQSAAGEKYLRAARKTFVEQYGANSDPVGLADFYLGKIEYTTGNFKKAASHWEASLEAFDGDSDDDLSQRLLIHAYLVDTYEQMGKSDLAAAHALEIGRTGNADTNQEQVPLFRVAPVYPQVMLMQEIEGHVDLEFTVDATGAVRNPVVIETVMSKRPDPGLARKLDIRGGDRGFEEAALEVVQRFRYAPSVVDGVAVPVEGVKTRITFEITDD